MLTPSQEWATIAAEFTTPGPIYGRFLLPMAAIGPLAATLGTVVFGVRGILWDAYDMAALDALTAGVLQYGLNLAGVYALALVVDRLAPTFSAHRNPVQALKVAAYSGTPYWLGGVLALLPKLSWMGALFGFYGIRMLALALPSVMKAPRDKAGAYTLVVAVAGILITLLTRALPTFFIR
ncbi:MAG: YIP1 family protein [Gemmatimonadetes bacterium]|nr:MAG: YIP1 family protein [Gemmatimonadota bacterium]